MLPDVVRVTIALDAEVAYHEERLAGTGARIFVDFSATRAVSSLLDQTLRFDQDMDVMRQVRIGRQLGTTTRVVMDAMGVASYSVYPLYGPYRLVIDLVASRTCRRASGVVSEGLGLSSCAGPDASGPFEPAANAVAAAPPAPVAARGVRPTVAPLVEPPKFRARLASRGAVPNWVRTLPSVSPGATAARLRAARATPLLPSRALTDHVARNAPGHAPISPSVIAEALAPAVPDVLPSVPSTATSAPAPAPGLRSGGFWMARQLGLGVSRIVIDPGHGGHDPGAKGKGGLIEAELVLDVSLRLQKLLGEVRGPEVILTRRRRLRAAARAHRHRQSGRRRSVSVDPRQRQPQRSSARRRDVLPELRQQPQRRSGGRSRERDIGQAMGALPDFVKAIALNNKLDESRDFATLVQRRWSSG